MFNIKIDDNLELRLRGMEDAQAFFELTDRNRQYLRPWFPWVDATQTAANTSAYLEKCQTQFEKGESLDLGILYKGEWVGSVGFNGIDKENRKAEIGYWLDEGAQGHGIMTRAVQALIDYGFEHLDLNKVFLRAATANNKSVAIPRRLKFKEEGILRQNEWMYDHFEDDYVFGLLRSEWEVQRTHERSD